MAFEFLTASGVSPPTDDELAEVRALAEKLERALNSRDTVAALAAIPAIGGTSHEVDEIVTPIARELGFESQKKDLFADYPVRLRPDWYRPVSDGRGGILFEVERGKTLTNNMDLLDLWKCHICREADHLFLVVPNQVQRGYGIENVYSRVVERMRTFTTEENRVNVDSIAVFGY